jgi:hypothetical protein
MKPWFPWPRKPRPQVIMREKLFQQDEQRTAWYRRMIEAAKRGSQVVAAYAFASSALVLTDAL